MDPIQYKISTRLNWREVAESYHNNWAKEHRGPFKATVELVKTLQIEPNDLILDLACGTGVVSNEISRHLSCSGKIVGIDISRTALLIAKSSISSYNKCLIEMDAENIGLHANFKKVACQYALTFFPNPKRVMRTIKNIMAVEGKIGIVVHGHSEKVPYFNTIMKPISNHIHDIKSLSPNRLGKPTDLSKILTDAGFSNISIASYTFQYLAGTFEDYWSEFFLSGYANPIRPLIFGKGKKIISSIRSDAQQMASRYIKDGSLHFPWEVLIATAYA